eukprot:g62386.t1
MIVGVAGIPGALVWHLATYQRKMFFWLALWARCSAELVWLRVFGHSAHGQRWSVSANYFLFCANWISSTADCGPLKHIPLLCKNKNLRASVTKCILLQSLFVSTKKNKQDFHKVVVRAAGLIWES